MNGLIDAIYLDFPIGRGRKELFGSQAILMAYNNEVVKINIVVLDMILEKLMFTRALTT